MENVKQILFNEGTTSSTGSNFVNFDKELEDDATSNSINQHKFQPKAERLINCFIEFQLIPMV